MADTDPRFPPVLHRDDDEITKLTFVQPPYIRVEYVAVDGVVYAETVRLSTDEDLNTLAHKCDWIAYALLAAHTKAMSR